MHIRWGLQAANPDARNAVIVQANVNGQTVPVYVSAEANDDHGLPACQRIAEAKIRATSGRLPSRVDVTKADFLAPKK